MRIYCIKYQPNVEIFPPTVWMHTTEERRNILTTVCGAFVEEFTDIKTFEVKPNDDSDNEDRVLVYAKEVMSFGLLYMELVDKVREGDGLWELCWWIFMLKPPAAKTTI